MKKRVLAFLLCLVMCLSLIPAAAFADAEIPEDMPLLEGDAAAEQPEDLPPLEGEVAAEQPEGSDAEEPAEEAPLSPSDAGTAPLAGEPEDEPPLEGEEAAEQPEGSDAEEPVEEEPLSPGEAGTAPLAEEPAGEPAEEDFEDPFLPVEEADDSVSDKAAGYFYDDPAGGKAQPVAGTLYVGNSVTARIEADSFVYYKFVPDADAVYVFSATSPNDTVGYLYSASWQLLEKNDDGPSDTNFCITKKLTKGTTYYLCVGYYHDDDYGSMPVTIKQLKTGWNKVGNYWYYTLDDGSYAKGWLKVSGTWYFFDESDGAMVADGGFWTDNHTKLYFFKSSGAWDNTKGWKTDSRGERYYVGSSGQLTTGWKTIDGKKYYFDSYSGWAYSGGVWAVDGTNYFFNSDGSLGTKGWNKNVHTYTWTDDNGGRHTNTYTYWYYLGDDNLPVTGWKKISGKWYYFDPAQGGRMYADGPWKIDGTEYYFTSSGALAGAGWQKLTRSGYDNQGKAFSKTDWFYTNEQGIVQTGWMKIGGKWYYFNPDYHGIMLCYGTAKIDGKGYYFAESGAMQTGWIKESRTYTTNGGSEVTYTYWYYANGSGVLQEGWQTIGGKKYYFQPNSYVMIANTSFPIDGVCYYFTESGAAAGAGWQSASYEYNGKNETAWYYCNADGSCVTGWRKIGSAWYYFDLNSGYMYAGGLFIVDNKWEFFKSNGAWVATGKNTEWRRDGSDMLYYKDGKMAKGWEKIEGEWYFFNRSTGKMQTGWQTIDGKQYYLCPEMKSNTIVSIGGYNYALGTDGVVVTKTGWYKQTHTTDGAKYVYWFYVDDSQGRLATGWRTIGGKRYYFDPTMLANMYRQIDGVYYYFDENGVGREV